RQREAVSGDLVDRVIPEGERAAALERAGRLRSLTLDPRTVADLELIATGGYSPLTGFLGSADYQRVIQEMRLADGRPWPLPITLRIDAASGVGDAVALEAPDGTIVGVLDVQDVYTASRHDEAQLVFGTRDAAHPGVAQLYGEGELAVGGDVWLLRRTRPPFPELALDPADTRRIFAERGWRTVVGFQTRYPVHRAHEYIQKAALEIVDGLLLQPLVERFRPAELGIQPLCFEHTFYCRRCGAMASPKTCPHDGDARVTLSGTRVRELLRSGELPPPEFSRPEVARALADGLKEVLA